MSKKCSFRENSVRQVSLINSRFVVIIAAVVIAVIICAMTAFQSKAATKVTTQPETYYTDIKLEKGDTLTSLAKKYNTGNYFTTKEYINELKRINGLDCDSIHEGCYLTIIYY